MAGQSLPRGVPVHIRVGQIESFFLAFPESGEEVGTFDVSLATEGEDARVRAREIECRGVESVPEGHGPPFSLRNLKALRKNRDHEIDALLLTSSLHLRQVVLQIREGLLDGSQNASRVEVSGNARRRRYAPTRADRGTTIRCLPAKSVAFVLWHSLQA
jgi:hypothetical protein